MYYTDPEITPHVSKAGDHRYNKAGDKVGKFASKEVEVRAVVEGQIMSKRIHCENVGLHVGKQFSDVSLIEITQRRRRKGRFAAIPGSSKSR